MPTDQRIDPYIAKAPEFAKPVLRHIREPHSRRLSWRRRRHQVEQARVPACGKLLCGLVAFKAHCSFYISQPEISNKLEKEGKQVDDSAGALSKVTQVADLPPRKELLRYIRDAVRLLDASLSNPSPRKRATEPKPEASIPDDLAIALTKNKRASQAFEQFSNSHRREYIEWITEAKRDETREKRVATALERLAEGKPRNWKYMNC